LAGIPLVMMVLNGVLLGAGVFWLVALLFPARRACAVLILVSADPRTRNLSELAGLAVQQRIALSIVIMVAWLLQASAIAPRDRCDGFGASERTASP
jgi:hypothetical protein